MEFIIKDGVLVEYTKNIPVNSLEDVIIPDGVTEIGFRAFSYKRIKSVTIPPSVKIIGDEAFFDCGKLETVVFSEGLEKIKKQAFAFSGVKNINLPESLKKIDVGAFVYCQIESIYIPEKTKMNGSLLFNMCRTLENIDVSENNRYYSSIDGVLFSKDKQTLLRYPDGKKDISYTIPDGVKTIKKNVFLYCENLESLTIPDSVDVIEKNAFDTCRELKHLTIHDSPMRIDDKFFRGYNKISAITIIGKKTKLMARADFSTQYGALKSPSKQFLNAITSPPEEKENILTELKDFRCKLFFAMYLVLEYDSETAKSYLKRSIRKAIKALIDNEDAENLTRVLEFGYITRKNVDDLIEYAITNKKPEMQIILSHFKNDNIGFKNNFDKFLL